MSDARARLAALLDQLGPDELAVMEMVAHGLVRGRQVYGELDVATDRRDLHAELGAELRDALVYAAAGLLRLQRTEGAR